MIAPAEEQMDRDLGVRSTVEFQLIFSIFLLAFAIGPLLLAPMSELYGRVVILQLANVVNFAVEASKCPCADCPLSGS